MRRLRAPAAALAFAVPCAFAAETPAPAGLDAKPPLRLECLKPNETREEVRARHFLEPFAVLKSAAQQTKAEALSAKLCRLGDDWVYSIALLHRDGRLVHVLMDAATGRIVSAHPPHESGPKT